MQIHNLVLSERYKYIYLLEVLANIAYTFTFFCNDEIKLAPHTWHDRSSYFRTYIQTCTRKYPTQLY